MAGLFSFSLNRCPKLKKTICLLLTGLLSGGSAVLAEGPVDIRATDVTLAESGLLRGVIVNTAAQPVEGIRVRIVHGEAVVATAVSSAQGDFSITGLRHGAHAIQVGETLQPVRLWGADTAPPVSTPGISIVVDEETVRGQMHSHDSDCCEEDRATIDAVPLLIIGGAIATVLVLTLDDNGSDAPSSP